MFLTALKIVAGIAALAVASVVLFAITGAVVTSVREFKSKRRG